MDEKLRNKLMGQLIEALQDGVRRGDNLNYLNVHFFQDNTLLCDCLGVAKALDCLYNDVYYFGDFDLRCATRLELHSI